MMKSSSIIPFYDRIAWMEYGLKVPVQINLEQRPHTLVFSNTGGGKTYLIKIMLAKIVKIFLQVELYICDFKGDDFSFLENEDRYYVYNDYMKGIEAFYERFSARLEKKDTSNNHLVLLLDEWNTFFTTISKKEQEHVNQMMNAILSMGRSKSCFIVMGVQRVHANIIPARDCFGNAVGLFALSKEAINMMYSDYKDEIVSLPRGQGYYLGDGLPLKSIIVPTIQSMDSVHEWILKGVRNRPM